MRSVCDWRTWQKEVSGFQCSCLKQQKKPDSLSLVFSLRFAPVECGGQGEKIPSGLPCPDCTSKPIGRLRKHAYYLRSFEDIEKTKIELKITRLRCSKCKKSHACLFPCLVPHSSYSADSVGKLVAPYLFEGKSCERIGWEVSIEGKKGHKHLVYRLVGRLCQKQDWIIGFVEKHILRQGESVWGRKEAEPEKDCDSGRRVRSAEKKAALNKVGAALIRFRESTGQALEAVIGLLHQVGMQSSAPFSLLSAAKVLLVRTTHRRGDALF
jgi:hypothetical protein